MIKKLTLRTVSWTCPSIENRKTITSPDQKTLALLCDENEVRRLMEENADQPGRSRYILPIWQNLESMVYAGRLLADGSFFNPSIYCLEDLADILDIDLDLLSDPMIQAVIKTIPHYADKSLVLELESPFSVLSAIMNPMNLYLCFEEEGDLLKDVLHRIADASAAYVKACAEAGCRVFSLADPVGTMNLVGEEYYRDFCGQSEVYLMKQCQPWLEGSIMHICLKMSQSLLIAGLAEAEPCQLSKKMTDHMDILKKMAEDERIHFTGMTCMHNSNPDLTKSYTIKLK